jgi:SAM-dependent methyltransferase
MPTIDENIQEWGARFDWAQQGDDWSAPFGGTQRLWHNIVHPRIESFLSASAGRILEIAPGHGRMTQFLLPAASHLTAVDLNVSCVEACRERFAGHPHLELHVNDGRSLAMIPDGSIDFAFSFDSLVHADGDVMRAYLGELARTLAPRRGVAFLHHSNAGAVARPLGRLTGRWAPGAGARVLRRANRNWRSDDVSARDVASMAEAVGLRCVVQEKVNWLSRLPLDCFSTITLSGSRWDRPPVIVRNLRFMQDARRARALSDLYRWD